MGQMIRLGNLMTFVQTICGRSSSSSLYTCQMAASKVRDTVLEAAEERRFAAGMRWAIAREGKRCAVVIARNMQIEREHGEQIRVMLVDDHLRVRQCLRIFLSTCEDIEVASEAGCGEEALRSFVETRPDVVVMDLTVTGPDGAAVTALMKQIDPLARVIALTSFPDLELSRRALEAGAFCCLLKDEECGRAVGGHP